MPREHLDFWDGSEYPHVPDDDDKPDVWEKEASKPPESEPDTRADFHGDDESDVWEKEAAKPQRSDV